MNTVARALWNPIVAKEYRSRMRTWRSPLAITIYVVILGGIGWAVFSAMANSVAGFGNQGGGPGSPSNLGQLLFTFLIIFQVGLLAFITPALTAGAISSFDTHSLIALGVVVLAAAVGGVAFSWRRYYRRIPRTDR